MIAYYAVATVISLINLIILIFRFEGKKVNFYFILVALLMSISCAGYLAIALSTELPEAILANKISYVGGCFVPPVIFFALCTICNFQFTSRFQNLLYTYSFVVYAMVLTIGYSDFYYKEVSLSSYLDATNLEHTYGPGHVFFNTILYGYIILEFALLMYSLYKEYSVPRKCLWAVTLLLGLNVVLFIVARYLNPAFEITPLMYVLDGFIILYMHRRIMMYNIEDCVGSFLGKQQTYGYIMFDNHGNYLGCNSLAKEIVPEMAGCRVDLPIKGIPKVDMILRWIDEYDKGSENDFSFESGDEHYQCRIERLWYKERACGYIVEMKEDTDKWNYLRLLSNYNTELESQVKEKTEHISNIQAQVVVGMADMLENRDDNTGGHIKRTSDVIRILVDVIREHELLSLSDEFCRDIIKAAPMHDLGKIAIDDKILRKPGRLNDEEFAIMQTHAEKSALLVESILRGVEEEHFVNLAVNVARYHHEKWNGTGYPKHLRGEEIPLEARIMAIADVYDALVSKRCYKEPMSFDKAYEVMEESMGSHFDPELEQMFLFGRDRLEEYYSRG